MIIPILIVGLVFLFVIPAKAHAIIILPALILIPIAKIIAILIGGFSIPALGLGTLWSKMFHVSLKRTLLSVVILLLIIAALAALILKIENPARPLF